jgi:formiminoglutamase
VAPGVSAPAALGVNASRALRLLRHALAQCGHGGPGSRLVMSDVAELNPHHDPDGRTARIAARLVYEVAAIG